MIDEKGKLFGKINIIDLFIIIVILAVGAYAVKSMTSQEVNFANTGSVSKYRIQFFTERVSDFVIDKVKVGDPVEEEGRVSTLGNVTEIQLDDAFEYNPDANGQTQKSTIPDHKSLVLTMEVDGSDYNHGVIIQGNKYSVGHSLTVRAGVSKIFGRIYSIEKIN